MFLTHTSTDITVYLLWLHETECGDVNVLTLCTVKRHATWLFLRFVYKLLTTQCDEEKDINFCIDSVFYNFDEKKKALMRCNLHDEGGSEKLKINFMRPNTLYCY